MSELPDMADLADDNTDRLEKLQKAQQEEHDPETCHASDCSICDEEWHRGVQEGWHLEDKERPERDEHKSKDT